MMSPIAFLDGSLPKQKRTLWIFMGILLLAVFLRVLPWGEPGPMKGLEFSDGERMATAAAPLSRIMSYIPPDVGPIRYYFLHGMLYFGRSEFLIGFPAFFFELLSIFMLFSLGRKLFDEKTALWASFFMAISPWHIRYATLARNYCLYAFSALISTYFLYQATQKSRLRDWLFYGVITAFSYYSFYQSVFILVAQLGWFFLFYARRVDLFKRLCLALSLSLLIVSPAIWQLVAAFKHKTGFGIEYPRLDIYQLFESLRDHFGGIAGPYPFGILFFALGFFSWVWFKKKRKEAFLLLSLVMIPTLLYVFCFIFFHINVISRYFLHLYPFFLLLAAGVMSWPNKAIRGLGAAVFMMPLCLYGLFQSGFIERRHLPPDYLRRYVEFAVPAALIEKNFDNLDFVVVYPWRALLGIQYYLDKKNEFPVTLFTGNKEQTVHAMCVNKQVTLYGTQGDLPTLKQLSAAGRLLVIDFLGQIKIFNEEDLTLQWLRDHAFRTEGIYRSGRRYSTDFYFIQPPESLSGDKNSRIETMRQQISSGARVSRVVAYPFNKLKAAIPGVHE